MIITKIYNIIEIIRIVIVIDIIISYYYNNTHVI